MFSHLRYAPNADCIHDSHARSLCALKNETWRLYKTFTKIFTEFLIDEHKFVENIRRFAIVMNWRDVRYQTYRLSCKDLQPSH